MAIPPLQLPGYSQAPDLNWTSLDQLGKTLGENRLNNQRKEAMSLASLGQDGSPDYKKTINSLVSLGDLTGAGQVAAIQKSIAPESSADMQAYSLYKKQGGALPFLDFKKQLVEAGATRVSNNSTVNTGGGGSDKQIFDSVDESYKAARTAAAGLSGLAEAKKALDAGIIAGAGADQRLGLQKVGALLGIADPTSIQNTETFRAAIAPQVAAMIKSTVGSAQISNADREFAEKAAGGSISLDAGSIRRLVDIMERAGTGIVKGHMERLDAIYPDEPRFRRERALFRVQPPSGTTGGQPIPPQRGQLIDGYRYRGGDPGNPDSWVKAK